MLSNIIFAITYGTRFAQNVKKLNRSPGNPAIQDLFHKRSLKNACSHPLFKFIFWVHEVIKEPGVVHQAPPVVYVVQRFLKAERIFLFALR